MRSPMMSQSRDRRSSADDGLQGLRSEQPRNRLQHLLAPSLDVPEDPLLEIVRRDHSAAMTFLRIVMLGSGVLGSLVALATGLFLMTSWHLCIGLDRPLHWWLLVNTFLQAIQAPMRLLFYSRISAEPQPVDALRAQVVVSSFTSSPAWRGSKQFTLVSYAWFIVGFVWVIKAGSCSSCPNVYHVAVAVLLQAMLRALAALVCFRVLFAHLDGVIMPAVQAASAKQIAALPSTCFRQGLFQDEDTPSCAVCLAEYCNGDCLVTLPCKHHFHRQCGEKWLVKSKTCPLCIRPIDEYKLEGVAGEMEPVPKKLRSW